MVYNYFFPTRRRHTRCLSDWSSDVCSSDLAAFVRTRMQKHIGRARIRRELMAAGVANDIAARAIAENADEERERAEIGRASCRERGEMSVGDVCVRERLGREHAWRVICGAT